MEGSDILRLPNEILYTVAEFLRGNDLISFSVSCRRFSAVCQCKRSISFENSWNITVPDLKSFLSSSIHPKQITRCNFSNCYWIPGKFIQSYLSKCINLSSLHVSGTPLSCSQLVSVLIKCQKISELSFTLQAGDLWKNQKVQHPLKNLKKDISAEYLLQSSHFTFAESKAVLNKLIKLEITSIDVIPEILAFLSFCDSVEELRIIFGKIDYETVLLLETGIYGLPPVHCRPRLTSLVLLNMKDQIQYERLYRNSQLIHSAEPDQLKTYWNDVRPFPSVQNVTEEIGKSSNSQGQHSLELLSIKDHTFMQNRQKAAQVRVVDCIYHEELFTEFCTKHPKLRALKLRATRSSEENSFEGSSNPESGKLPELRALCIEPSLIAEDVKASAAVPFHDERPLLHRFLRSCSDLEELEIISLGRNCGITNVDLSFIAQCRALRKLTLAHFHVQNGRFLEQIFTGCTKLESLRLSNLGSLGLCCYTKSLCVALPKASKLKHFSLMQRNVVPLGMLLDALEKCPSLVHLGLNVPSYCDALKLPAEQFLRRFLRLAVSCSQLVALFCVLTVAKSHCIKATKLLAQQLTPTRPSFQAEFQSKTTGSDLNVDVESNVLAPVHQQLLVHFNSSVANRPYGCQPSLLLS